MNQTCYSTNEGSFKITSPASLNILRYSVGVVKIYYRQSFNGCQVFGFYYERLDFYEKKTLL